MVLGRCPRFGDTVVVSSSAVQNPKAVRYAWQSNPAATLYNKAGLPAVPFRTDNWPGLTDDKPALLTECSLVLI